MNGRTAPGVLFDATAMDGPLLDTEHDVLARARGLMPADEPAL